jgi:ATP-dependent exoDNAse (exonuclease V) alpha subunit
MNDGQRKAVEMIESGKNVFLTGPGGVGKSYVIQHITDNNTVKCAPTGIAAINIGGSTCHSLFQLPIGLIQKKDEVNISASFRKRWGLHHKHLRVVIDEISMLRADYLDLIDKKLKKVRKSDKPFGGVQMVVVGDFFQLPPIVAHNEKKHFYKNYLTEFAFGAKCWDFHTVCLNEVVRQSDREQVDILSSIREGERPFESISRLLGITNKSSPKDVLHLCSFNKDASRINKRKYMSLEGDEYVFYAKHSDSWGKEEPSPRKLRVKRGMRVLMTANHDFYVNGDRGVVESVDEEDVVVRLDSTNAVVKVESNLWEKYSYKEGKNGLEKTVSGWYEQLSIRYGWAVSIHKSQGMTLDEVVIDVGNGCFSHGQLYVALSRCRDLSKVSIGDIDESDIIVDENVKKYNRGG